MLETADIAGRGREGRSKKSLQLEERVEERMINVKVFTWYSPCCMVKKSLLLFHYWQKMKPLEGMEGQGCRRVEIIS